MATCRNAARYFVYGITFVSLSYLTCASLDLYVGRRDASKLLGVSSQLWYVQNGKININALNYVILVPHEMNILTFYWQNHLNSTMPYTLHIEMNDEHALYKPKLWNIKKRGLVPNELALWKIILNCTGNFITEVHVNITLNIPLAPSLVTLTKITVQRRKICNERKSGRMAIEVTQSQDSAHIVYIIIGFLTFFLITLSSMAAFKHIRNNKLRNRARRSRSQLNGSIVLSTSHRSDTSSRKTGQFSGLRDEQPSHDASSSVTISNSVNIGTQYRDPRLGNITNKLDMLRGDVDAVTYSSLEMEGTFGRIHRGFCKIGNTNDPTPVIIKTVSDCASEVQRGVFISEGVMLAGLEHDHIMKVIIASVTPDKPPLIVFKCDSDINLKKYLQNCHSLVTKDVVSLGLQLLDALSFIHEKFIVHMDVACRNCVVNDNFELKLTDCALSRDLFPSDYHCLGDNENRPVKWMAFECLTRKSFFTASDVWSFGVFIWELMTMGQQPYGEIDPFDMVNVLRRGMRLAQPFNCPDELFKAMTLCWTISGSERPTVHDLQQYLKNFLDHLSRFV